MATVTQAAKLQAELDAMKSKIAQMDQPKSRWVPEYGDRYYVISLGSVWCHKYVKDIADINCLSIGNYFRTKEEAERHVEKLKVIEELKSLAGYWEPDFRNINQVKWYIAYIHSERKFEVLLVSDYQDLNNVYFESKSDAQNAINVLGDRLKVLL